MIIKDEQELIVEKEDNDFVMFEFFDKELHIFVNNNDPFREDGSINITEKEAIELYKWLDKKYSKLFN